MVITQQLQVGMSVYGSNGRKLGRVEGLEAGYFRVRAEGEGRELGARLEDIRAIEGAVVALSVPRLRPIADLLARLAHAPGVDLPLREPGSLDSAAEPETPRSRAELQRDRRLEAARSADEVP